MQNCVTDVAWCLRSVRVRISGLTVAEILREHNDLYVCAISLLRTADSFNTYKMACCLITNLYHDVNARQIDETLREQSGVNDV